MLISSKAWGCRFSQNYVTVKNFFTCLLTRYQYKNFLIIFACILPKISYHHLLQQWKHQVKGRFTLFLQLLHCYRVWGSITLRNLVSSLKTENKEKKKESDPLVVFFFFLPFRFNWSILADYLSSNKIRWQLLDFLKIFYWRATHWL